MLRLARMQKDGWNTGGTESRSNVHSNLPGFSHTGSYQFSLFLVYLFYNQFHRFFISVCYGDLGILQKNDLLLLISNSGKTREIVELTRLAHNLDPDLKFIVITGNPDSPLAKESDVCLSTGKPAEVCVLGMTPTTSTTAMTVIGDILVVQTMKETGFTIAEYSKRHHGGYLGEKSRSLCEK